MDECVLLIYCFVIVDNKSIQLPSPHSKTGLLSRSPIVRLKRSAKSAPKDVLPE